MRRLLGLVAAGLLLLSAAPAAMAAAPVAVDPSTLTPALPPSFDWSCLAVGNGFECVGTEVGGGVDVDLGPDFSCGGVSIHDTFTQTRTMRRSYDAAGRQTGGHLVGSFDHRWRPPRSDPLLNGRGRGAGGVDLALPGGTPPRPPP